MIINHLSITHHITHRISHHISHHITHPITHPITHHITHPITHPITHRITHLSTRFVAATVSSFEATFSFYLLPFEKHITFSQNYDYLTNTEELIIPKLKKLTEFTTSPSMAEVNYK